MFINTIPDSFISLLVFRTKPFSAQSRF